MSTVATKDVDILNELESLGSEQFRKTYRRHGVLGDQFGVSTANLQKLQKRIKVDHALALNLWRSGNYDARVFATMIADPKQATPELLEEWVNDCDNYGICGYVAGFAGKTAFAVEKATEWVKSDEEWRGRTGWLTLAGLAENTPDLPDQFFEDYLAIIERDIHTAKNYARLAMNSALIAIGIRNDHLEKLTMEATSRIGKVDVDHGDTNCKTPDAADYIQKTLDYRRKKAKK